MKKIFYILGICLLLTSCAMSSYYQIYHTNPITKDVKVNDNVLVFEDDNCIISYDFWAESGNIGFKIYNKNSENLYLHLDECFFVKNGYAYDYYQNRTYSRSSTTISSSTSSYSLSGSFSSTSAQGYANASGSSNTYKNGYIAGGSNTIVNSASNGILTVEQKIICIPPQTAKIISEFSIVNKIFHSCDLYLNPGKKDNKTLQFTQEDTPLKFGNIIAYSIGDSENLIRINNDFYISKVSNLTYDEITEAVYEEECGKKFPVMKRVVKESGPDMFYRYYNVNSDLKRH